MALLTDFKSPVQETLTFGKDSITFVSTLAHRQPQQNDLPPPTVPHKRKGFDLDDSASISSQSPRNGFLPESSRRYMSYDNADSSSVSSRRASLRGFETPIKSSPSPSVNGKAGFYSNVSVVIPSPQQPLRKSTVPIGISERFFPTKALDYESAARRAYPEARSGGGRALVSFSTTAIKAAASQADTSLEQKRFRRPFNLSPESKLTISVDEEKLAALATNFHFVEKYVIGQGVTPVEDEFNAGCECHDNCRPETCGCLAPEVESDKLIVPYVRRNGQLVLRPDFLKRKSMIYECSYRCSCAGDCWNHVVQRGRQIRLEIFDTGERGFGLRSRDPIVAGQFIDRYLGEVITKADADAREAADQEGQSYLFGLDFIQDDDDIWVVDGQKLGCATRFMNHSCNPNCKIIPVSTDNHADDRLYYLAFFARRDIPAGTELTFDYNPSWDGTMVYDPHAVQCKCGEKRCRGQLWPNARKTEMSD
ncbi:hypothetical protein N7512_004044 [Penicillium capsulatum]|nr:hypothetical protein N7512_004044 [Penicillium capsulatum]